MTETTRTEADAILEWADQHRDDIPADVTDPFDQQTGAVIKHLIVPNTHVMVTVDPEPVRDRPRRTVGTIDVHDASSFVAGVNHRADPEGNPPVVVYCDEPHLGLCAVLNDDHLDTPGWRDHRVSLRLRTTPEWQRWADLGRQGLGSQERFAEQIEDGENEIREPDAATMLEIAQTFHASSNASFTGGVRLPSGARQFIYDEHVTAKAGKTGSVEVPEVFTLALKPFVGSLPYEVKARLRFRLTKDAFQIGYVLVRPDEVLADAFRTVAAEVTNTFGDDVLVLAGPAPSPARGTGSVSISR